MRTRRFVLCVLCCLLRIFAVAFAQTAANDHIQLTLDTSEADQVLAILALRQAQKPIADMQWQKLFATPPYQRLKQREKKIGEQFHDPSVAFTDEDFKKFVLSGDLFQRAPRLRETLEHWKQADLRPSANHVLAYLPEQAVIRAKVYPVIKPGRNSFVWELSSDPTIFLYLDPEVTRGKFENNVAHELHHIGLGSLGPVYTQKIAALPERARSVAGWMESFGEGLAGFNNDLPAVNNFFLDVLSGKLADNDTIEAKGSSFFGSHQGPWYTVGYKMAVMVERRYGRPVLIRTMLDYRCLLVLYNQAAAEQNATGKQQFPLWSETVLSQVDAGTCGISLTTGL
jgi:hypothetical protein